MRWPDPDEPAASRAWRAASTATAPSIPVVRSETATPTFVGRPPSASAWPVIDMRPDTAWTMKSKPGLSRSGPSVP